MMELSFIQKVAIWALPVIFAITLHEVAHGWVASKFGDQTARLQGRLTLNPIKHIDLVGTVIVPLLMLLVSNFIFGWAKPVPVDPRNLKNPRRDMAYVAAAGPVSNLAMALFWAALAKIGTLLALSGHAWLGVPLTYMGGAGIMINVVLGVLNFIPIPPLDGSKVVMSLLSPAAARQYSMIEPFGFFILVALLVSGILSYILGPPVFFIINLIAGIFGLQ